MKEEPLETESQFTFEYYLTHEILADLKFARGQVLRFSLLFLCTVILLHQLIFLEGLSLIFFPPFFLLIILLSPLPYFGAMKAAQRKEDNPNFNSHIFKYPTNLRFFSKHVEESRNGKASKVDYKEVKGLLVGKKAIGLELPEKRFIILDKSVFGSEKEGKEFLLWVKDAIRKAVE